MNFLVRLVLPKFITIIYSPVGKLFTLISKLFEFKECSFCKTICCAVLYIATLQNVSDELGKDIFSHSLKSLFFYFANYIWIKIYG